MRVVEGAEDLIWVLQRLDKRVSGERPEGKGPK